MTDEEWLSETRRRLANDQGARYDLEDVLREFDLCVDDWEPDTPQRLWVLTEGNWSSPRSLRYTAKGAPPLFRAGDEFGNRTLCVRLPGKRLLVLNLGWPMSRELWEPTPEEIVELERRVANDKGNRHNLDDVIVRLGVTREELDEEDDDE